MKRFGRNLTSIEVQRHSNHRGAPHERGPLLAAVAAATLAAAVVAARVGSDPTTDIDDATSSQAGQARADIVHADRTGDVWAHREEATSGYVPARRNGDIEAVVVKHTPRTLVIRANYLALNPEGAQFWAHSYIKTDTRESGWLPQVTWERRGEDGSTCRGVPLAEVPEHCWEFRRYLEDLGSGEPSPCPDMHATVDFGHDVVVLQIPFSCIGDPGMVRLGYVSALFTTEVKYHQDDGFSASQPDSEIVESPWIDLNSQS